MHSWVRMVVTRKSHRCFGCHRYNVPGAEMEFCATHEDDEFHHTYMCLICVAVRGDYYTATDLRDGLMEGEIYDNYRNEWWVEHDRQIDGED